MLQQCGEKIERLSFDLGLVHQRGAAGDDNDAEAHRRCRLGLARALSRPIPIVAVQKSSLLGVERDKWI